MSPDSLYFRGHGQINTDWLSDWAVDVDTTDRFGLVVTAGFATGDSRPCRLRPNQTSHRAEIAFEVADALHGHGIGTLLLGQLAAVAANHGIDVFVASVMASNRKMIEVLTQSGFPVGAHTDGGVTEISLPTTLSAGVLAAFDRRQHTASRQCRAQLPEPGLGRRCRRFARRSGLDRWGPDPKPDRRWLRRSRLPSQSPRAVDSRCPRVSIAAGYPGGSRACRARGPGRCGSRRRGRLRQAAACAQFS